jgi:hypothetical protein
MIPNEKYDNGLFKNIMPMKVANYVFKKPASKLCCPIRLPTTLKKKIGQVCVHEKTSRILINGVDHSKKGAKVIASRD